MFFCLKLNMLLKNHCTEIPLTDCNIQFDFVEYGVPVGWKYQEQNFRETGNAADISVSWPFFVVCTFLWCTYKIINLVWRIRHFPYIAFDLCPHNIWKDNAKAICSRITWFEFYLHVVYWKMSTLKSLWRRWDWWEIFSLAEM